MKHPYETIDYICTETICFFIGHNWKSSWRKKDNADELMEADYESLPYRMRQSGNAYFEHSEGWTYKCRRCRLKISDHWPWLPLWNVFVMAGKNSYSNTKIEFECSKKKMQKLLVILIFPLKFLAEILISLEEKWHLPQTPIWEFFAWQAELYFNIDRKYNPEDYKDLKDLEDSDGTK